MFSDTSSISTFKNPALNETAIFKSELTTTLQVAKRLMNVVMTTWQVNS